MESGTLTAIGKSKEVGMIKEIYRGSGMTELICVEGGENDNENIHKGDEQDPGDVSDASSDFLYRNKGTVKGGYSGRGGIRDLFDHLLRGGRKLGGRK